MVSRSILHVDMDAFYASVEQRDDPSLRGKPVLVGGRSRRSVVAAASYEARAFGARSAMPMAEALRKVPDAIVIPPRMDRYAQASDGAFAIFRRYTPVVEPLSLDEAFLDVTGSVALFGDGEAIARAIKAEIRDELRLTASAGVAACKFVAKIASDLRKPDGLVVVRPGEERSFLAPLPVERMWGVGQKTAPKMHALGYATLGDLARADEDALERAFGRWGAQMGRLARGEDDRPVVPDRQAKSIGAEQTYEEDLVGHDAVAATLLEHASRIARRLVRADISARTVTVKVKYASFQLVSRQITLPEAVQDTDAIHRAALAALERVPLEGKRVRLTGVSAGGIEDGPPQPTLFGDPRAPLRRAVEDVAAKIADRYGDERVLTRAALLEGASEELPRGRERRPGPRES
jgi:DNA polymerase-4